MCCTSHAASFQTSQHTKQTHSISNGHSFVHTYLKQVKYSALKSPNTVNCAKNTSIQSVTVRCMETVIKIHGTPTKSNSLKSTHRDKDICYLGRLTDYRLHQCDNVSIWLIIARVKD